MNIDEAKALLDLSASLDEILADSAADAGECELAEAHRESQKRLEATSAGLDVMIPDFTEDIVKDTIQNWMKARTP